MASLVEQSANDIAEALSPTPVAPSARWRWGTVKAVTEYGTMNVEVGGSILLGIRASRHCMSAKVGDRVRVSYYGTEALVDAIRATEPEQPYLRFAEVTTATQSIPAGNISYYDVEAPTYTGYTLRGAIQSWASGSGTVIIGASYRSAADNHMHFVVRANNSASVAVKALLLYTRDMITS